MLPARQKRVHNLGHFHTQPIEWLWPAYLPAGKLTVLDGDPGMGKSLLTLDLAARLTTARPLPDDFLPPAACPVLLLPGEDGRNDTLLPRLDSAGADLNRIHLFEVRSSVDAWDSPPTFPEDCPLLRDTIKETGARLAILDPFLAFLSARISNVSDQWVRQALTPLAQVAEETRAAILLVRHLTKGGHGKRAIYRGSGAIAVIGAARTAFLAGRHPTDSDLRLLACTKNNLAVPPPTLAYRIATDPLGHPRIDWAGTVPLTADDLVLTPTHKPGELLPEAVAFLSDHLAAGPCRRDWLVRKAHAQGLSNRTLERAKSQLHVISEQRGESSRNVWYWRLPTQEETTTLLTDLWEPTSQSQE